MPKDVSEEQRESKGEGPKRGIRAKKAKIAGIDHHQSSSLHPTSSAHLFIHQNSFSHLLSSRGKIVLAFAFHSLLLFLLVRCLRWKWQQILCKYRKGFVFPRRGRRTHSFSSSSSPPSFLSLTLFLLFFLFRRRRLWRLGCFSSLAGWSAALRARLT